MNWCLLAIVFFIVSLHHVFVKKPTDSTVRRRRAVIQPLLEVKLPKLSDFTKHEGEEWPGRLKRSGLRHVQRKKKKLKTNNKIQAQKLRAA